MSSIVPLEFQDRHIRVLVERFRALKRSYDLLGPLPVTADLQRLRHESACVMLQAPTGVGKTLMACEMMSRFSPLEKIIWFWFAPFSGVLFQAKAALKRQATNLSQLDIEVDRQVEKLSSGSVFVLSWQTVAARSAESRLARLTGDAGLGLDQLVLQAKDSGYRIGLIVDEAHHGFIRATEASRFFSNILAPDYVLLMTATPRDADALKFSEQTGYRIGGVSEWASITRQEGVDAELLKPTVKAARFIAQNQDDAQLIAFEEVAMTECAAMHALIKKTLLESKIGITPLMLVQVPNGTQAMQKARDFLVNKLKFTESSVRIHTADEPDPNLAALADDPSVEVLLFKMAVATGFDAPRAFTLAALRGARSANFGIQVVGRILRVHRLLQGRMRQIPHVLRNGYVFLANSEAQEGLVDAATLINAMPEQLAAAAPSTLVTVVAGRPQIQIVERGQTFSLMPSELINEVNLLELWQVPPQSNEVNEPQVAYNPRRAPRADISEPQGNLFGNLDWESGGQFQLANVFALSSQSSGISYQLRQQSPRTLLTERLPPLPENLEERLVSNINFSRVLGDRLKVRTRVVERTTDVFSSPAPQDRDVWASVSVTAIADRARQIAFEFEDVDRRALLSHLKKRFRDTLIEQGNEPPESEEELTRQLELVLVRNDKLIRVAYKRVRAEQVTVASVSLPIALTSDIPLTASLRNIYGVFPPSISGQEREYAELLDTAKDVEWWHRNPVRKPESIALYGWADGVGFFPDFVVKVLERTEGDGVALSELKGPQLQQYDRAKAAAVHLQYGRVFMVGKTGSEGGFRMWRLTSEDRLVDDGPFEVNRMRFS